MSGVDLPLGDRKISELIGSDVSESGAAVRRVIKEEVKEENLATKEYVTAMSIAFS